MTLTTKYITKIVEIGEVGMSGKLDYVWSDEDESGAWRVGKYNLEEWLEKFKGRYVFLTISNSDRDESKLLEE